MNVSPLVRFAIINDGIPQPLSATPGDLERGRAIVVNRQVGLCVLCHLVPDVVANVGEKSQDKIATSLAGAGNRWTEAQLRLRLVDSRTLNPASVMPSYYRVDGLVRVGMQWRDKPILYAQQIEDVVAYLMTLK